jgi:hypothetical protein
MEVAWGGVGAWGLHAAIGRAPSTPSPAATYYGRSVRLRIGNDRGPAVIWSTDCVRDRSCLKLEPSGLCNRVFDFIIFIRCLDMVCWVACVLHLLWNVLDGHRIFLFWRRRRSTWNDRRGFPR